MLFLLFLRRSGERAGRMAQRLDTLEKANDTCNAGCWRRRLDGLVLATSWLGGCATGGFEPAVVGVCPPVIEYSAEVRARPAEELELFPDGSAIVEMLGNYAVMRKQVRAYQLRLLRQQEDPGLQASPNRRFPVLIVLRHSIDRATPPV